MNTTEQQILQVKREVRRLMWRSKLNQWKRTARLFWFDLKISSPALGVAAFLAVSAAAWITHVFWIVITLADPAGSTFGQIALGAMGTVFFPLGVVHGFAIWIGLGV